MVRDERLSSAELRRIDEAVRATWPTGAAADFEDGVSFHESLSGERGRPGAFARTLESADRPLLQPRAGVPRLEDQIDLLDQLATDADLLPVTVDSYTRDNDYEAAAAGLAEARETGADALNGFPAVNHGVDGCRELVRAADAPVEVRHGTPDARLLAAVTLSGGFDSFEGGPISYNIPYTKEAGLEETVAHWQYVDRLAAAYTERGVTVNREPFGPLTGTLVPPAIAIAVMLVEGRMAATQGVESITLGYGQVGNLVQDVAALRALRALGEDVLPDSVTVTTVFHQWMGGFPPDEARASGVIGLGAATAAVAKPDKVVTKSPQEFAGVPTAEANAAGLRTTRQVLDMVAEQDLVLDGVDDEQSFVEDSAEALYEAVLQCGDGDVARGVVRAFASGALDVPFAPSDSAAGDVLPARDDDGRVRILEFGSLALPEDLRDVHRGRLEERARSEGRDPDFRMVADDVAAVGEGRLVGRPGGGE